LLPHGTFNKPRDVFGHVTMAARAKSMAALQSVPEIHDYPFKPCGPGKKNKLLAPFPKFKPDPPKEVKR